MLHLRVLILLLLLGRSVGWRKTDGKNFTNFPAILVFGDSTVDTGNNNYIATAIKGNHYPYGKDFPGHVSTGRFSNGKLSVDFIASMLGVKQTIPPFLQPYLSANELRTGVCFASAGTGYDDLTAAITGVVPVGNQVDLFEGYRKRLKKIVGDEEAKRIIGGSLVIISAGTNDFIFNYYDAPTRRLEFDIDGYQDFILERVHNFVKELYYLGCRTLVLAGLPPIGCLPIQITANIKGRFHSKCVEEQNADARAYNRKLVALLTQIQMSLKGSRLFYADIYNPIMDIIRCPKQHGFRETMKGCCGTGLLEAGPLCTPLTPLCHNSSEYMFFDSIHPSEKTYRYVTECLKKQILDKLYKST
ncbi:GDSL-like Lipase/Acylhydrolase family protein [Artemisia annua]|uniref:GDSL-like Lipase/Acylhydrolase family protein n=1 Tax=Artemisia annua TaxID=35608 RepID=A0A2U1Q1U7_ARTAN|nr:GDSL-like Lipase/Acylhydrolase family protein [Artemisia annua]